MLEPHVAVEIEGSEELQLRLEGIDRNLRGDRLVEPWERVVEFVVATAREYAPRWLGALYGSINGEVILGGAGGGGVYPKAPLRGVTREDITGVIYSDEFYAPFQERGTEPYFPSLEGLKEWAEDHDISPYYVATLIAERGIRPIKFFERAITEREDLIFDLIGRVIAEIMEEEY